MQKRKKVWSTFIVFCVFSIIIILFAKTGIGSNIFGFIGSIFSPLVGFTRKAAVSNDNLDSSLDLTQEKLSYKQLQKENQALRDQFQTTTIPSSSLIPANIIGSPSFIPGITLPKEYILDKGTTNGAVSGLAVVYKNNLVGTIVSVSKDLSKATLIGNSELLFTVKTVDTGAIGVAKGQADGGGGGILLLDNVLLSEALKKGDIVVTKGDKNEKGHGFPPGLVVGKIISIEKKPSALFQTALIKSDLNFSKLSTVFIIK